MLGADTCARYNIPMSLDLVGRMLICSFKSRELPQNSNRGIDKRFLLSDDVMICLLKKTEAMIPYFAVIPPSKQSKVSRTLELSSFGGGAAMHFHIMPCPFYKIILELTDEEYEACKELPPTSVFKISFRLA